MLNVIKTLLNKIINDIDTGNSHINEKEAFEIVESLKRYTNKEEKFSKYSACKYLNISRATFDNYVKAGKIPEGKHTIGFKEKSWLKSDLDKYLKANLTIKNK